MDRRIQIVTSEIENRLAHPRTIQELAQLVNLSASRLRHLFKIEIGITPAQYLKRARMQKAEMLLRTTFLSVKEIINRVGMTNGSHFVHEFKKAYGVAPTRYRSTITSSADPLH